MPIHHHTLILQQDAEPVPAVRHLRGLVPHDAPGDAAGHLGTPVRRLLVRSVSGGVVGEPR